MSAVLHPAWICLRNLALDGHRHVERIDSTRLVDEQKRVIPSRHDRRHVVAPSLGARVVHAADRAVIGGLVESRNLHARAGPTFALASLDSLVADTARTRTIVFARAVRIDIVYEIAEVRDAELWLYPDVYRLVGARVASIEAQAIQALPATRRSSASPDCAPHHPAALRITRLHALADSAHRAAVRISGDSLFPSPTMR